MKITIPSRLRRCAAAALCCALAPLGAHAVEKQLTFTKQEVAPVWSGHPVGFALLTAGDIQYVGYYDAERNMVIASHKLDGDQWTRQVLPTKIGWDSHNYITMALDRAGQLHIFGNMHACPMIYFRTEKPGDVTSIKRIAKMTGDRENSMTYPQFIKADDGQLIYTYRDGHSGQGDTLYNKYDEKTQTWTRLLDKPLFNGQNKMNAYPLGPIHGPDGYWHMSWVWRNSYNAETNHDLSYIRSKDLVHWENIEGKPLTLPISLLTPGVIVDPIPVEGGIINGSGRLGFDDKNRVVITYHKFDQEGHTQGYFTRFENGKWTPRQFTNWTSRWEPKGGGSLPWGLSISALRHDADIGYFIGVSNKKEPNGGGNWKVDPETLTLGAHVPTALIPDRVPSEATKLTEGSDSRMVVKTASDSGTAPMGTRYVLKWETLPTNRDVKPEGPIPPPSPLQLIKITETAK